MLTLKGITVKFDGQTVIDGLNFTFEDGKFYGITGPSGIGKTTLINTLAGLITPTHGKILRECDKCAYIFQEPRLFPWLTAIENVECVCKDRALAEHYLGLLLPEGADKYPHELSGGMKQRVSIARALAYDAPLLLLDEPFRGLDADTKQATLQLVTEHISTRTAILISHDHSELELCGEIYKMTSSPVRSLTKAKSGSDVFE